MAQAPTYVRTTDFSSDELLNVGGRSTVRTDKIDAELDALGTTANALVSNVSLNQRDDGEIRDQRVKLFTLAPDVLKLLTLLGGTVRGAWVTATVYVAKDVVTQGGNTYVAATAHTSGVFATDLAAVRWVLVQLGAGTAASGVPFTPTATLAATNVQAAIDESDTENRALSAAYDAALRADLASTALPTKNAGQIGFAYALGYAVGTIGRWMQDLATVVGAGLIGYVRGTGYAASTVGWQLENQGGYTNLLSNSELSICTALPLRWVGSPITVSTYVQTSGTFDGRVTFGGGTGNLLAGKLVLINGPGTPHAPIVAVAGAVTSNKRITCAAATFAGLAVGDLCDLTGGANTSPRLKFPISATDASTYIELQNVSGGGSLVNETSTYSMTFYKGAYALVDTSVNGFPAAGRADITSAIGYPLKVTSVTAGLSFIATCDGGIFGVGGSGTGGIAWEVVPGDDGFGTGNGPDGWAKTATLRYWRMYGTDELGVDITRAGSIYAGKAVKGSAGVEYFSTEMTSIKDPLESRSNTLLRRYRGRKVCFGMAVWAPGANKARLFHYDGVSFTYGAYAAAGAYQWLELPVTVSTNATRVQFGVEVTGAIGDKFFWIQPMTIFGNVIGDGNYTPSAGFTPFTSHPNFPKNYINGTVSNNRPVRIEQESLGCLPEGLKAIHCGVEGYNPVPGGLSGAYAPALTLAESSYLRIPSISMYMPQERSFLQIDTGATTAPAAATTYFGKSYASAAESQLTTEISIAARAMNIYVGCGQSPGVGQTFTYTFRKNGVDTPLTVVITGAAQANNLDTGPGIYVSLAAGDSYTCKVVASAGAPATWHSCSVTINRNPDHFIVNSGVVTLGKTLEGDATTQTDSMYVYVGSNANWAGVNIDMFGAQQ